MHLNWHAYQVTFLCKYEVTIHMATWENQRKDTLVTLLLILTGYLFESLLLMSWIAEEPFSLPDFPLMYLLSLKGMHDEGNYSCRLRGIQRLCDARTIPTFRIQLARCTEYFLIFTFCPESSFSFTPLHNTSLGFILNIPTAVGPFSLKRDRMSWEKEREIPVTLYAVPSTIGSGEADQWCAQVQCKGWHGQEGLQTGLDSQSLLVQIPPDC